jgi:hypothetical protein
MITLEGDRLVFRFPEVDADATCTIEFQRTLRIPDDGKDYPLPPGFGTFPLRHLDDFAPRVPEQWLARGGVVMPMHQAEAMWINFCGGGSFGGHSYPCAVKIATGKINAVTGEAWVDHLNSGPQDYVVLPNQPWLDGYCVEKGCIRQFVAMPLGGGYSVEEQLTGAGEHGGVQLIVYPMKAALYQELLKTRAEEYVLRRRWMAAPTVAKIDMGLAPGGRMRQQIFNDPHGIEVWDQSHCSRCFVTIANSTAWVAITGERPPTEPPTAKKYTEAGFPWFDYYDAEARAVEGAEKLKYVLSVDAKGKEKGEAPLRENESLEIDRLVRLRKRTANEVREMRGVISAA